MATKSDIKILIILIIIAIILAGRFDTELLKNNIIH